MSANKVSGRCGYNCTPVSETGGARKLAGTFDTIGAYGVLARDRDCPNDRKGVLMTFSTLDTVPSDSILGLMAEFQADPAVDKVDLTVGVYRDEHGRTPVMTAVARAEEAIVREQASKAYLPVLGPGEFLEPMRALIAGPQLPAIESRLGIALTPGGCGALRVGAELFALAQPGKSACVSSPTWPNHYNLISGAGVPLETHPYYDPVQHRLEMQDMADRLERAPAGSLVVLQAACHNPTGADPGPAEWRAILDILGRRSLVPFFDMAYQGMGADPDEDAAFVRAALAELPEVLVAASCSKNFGLYRERTGALLWLTETAVACRAAASQVGQITRRSYSMPPAHGGLIVGRVLADPELRQAWRQEVAAMAVRLRQARRGLAAALSRARPDLDCSWIEAQRGMFSLLGIDAEAVQRLREEHHIYIVGDSRINLAGLNDQNTGIVAEAIAPLMR